MTTCGAIGALTVGGKVVGQLRCELHEGHAETRFYQPGYWLRGVFHPDGEKRVGHEATPHRVTLTWTPESAPDLDLFDPAESFDVDVPLTVDLGYD